MSQEHEPKFNRPLEYARHVVGDTIKGAAKWAAIGMVLATALAIINPLALLSMSGSTLLGSGATFFGIQTGLTGFGAQLASYAASGIMWGGIAGAALSGLKAIGTAGDAVDTKEEEVREKYLRKQLRKQQTMLMEQQLQAGMPQPGYGMGLTPNVGYGKAMEGHQLGT